MTDIIYRPQTDLEKSDDDLVIIPDHLRDVLLRTRSQNKIIEGHLPADDFPNRPNEKVTVLPYYMNTGDPEKLGVWKLTIGENFTSRIQSIPVTDGVVDSLEVLHDQTDSNAYIPANQEEIAFVNSVLNYVSDRIG